MNYIPAVLIRMSCLPNVAPVRASGKGNDKGKVEAWWGTRAATSWCRCRPSKASMHSMPTWNNDAWNEWTPSSGDIRRPSARGLSRTGGHRTGRVSPEGPPPAFRWGSCVLRRRQGLRHGLQLLQHFLVTPVGVGQSFPVQVHQLAESFDLRLEGAGSLPRCRL